MRTADRFGLGVFPTPLVRARRLQDALGCGPIWVKRDDLSGFAVAGNKARALELLLADAIAGGADVLVATGSPGSHFCAAAAAAARAAGLDCEVVYAGAEPSPVPVPVRLARAAGAVTHFAGALARDDLDTAVVEHAARLRAAGRRPYAVPRGGATPVGATGFALAAHELAAQCAAVDLDPAVVVLPTGSGASQAGLLVGLAQTGLRVRVVGASVSRPVAQLRSTVLELAGRCARLLGTAGPQAGDVEVRDAVGPGFGVAGPADRQSARLAYLHEGLLLDDTYTAKAMTVLREVAAGTAGPVLFWHTGGIDGALAAVRPPDEQREESA